MKDLPTYLSEKLVVNKEFRNLDTYNIYSQIDKILSSSMKKAEPVAAPFKKYVGFKLPATRQTEKTFVKITKLISDNILSKDNTLFNNNKDVLDYLNNTNNVIFRYIYHKSGCQFIKKLDDDKYIIITLYEGATIDILKNLKHINFDISIQYNCSIDIFYDILDYVFARNLSPDAVYVTEISELLSQNT